MDAGPPKDVPPFAGLSGRKRKVVAQHADEIELPAGSKLAEQGTLAYELFVIVEGGAGVLDGEGRIRRVGPGDVLGEIGVLETHKRTATVVATSPVKAVVMYGAELRALKNAVPDVFAHLEDMMRQRLQADADRS